MDSVRYHSYHQWKEASKADSNKTSTYHEKLLTNVEALEGNVNQIDKLIAGYLDATKAFCGAGSQLAEAFSTILNETPLLELPQQLKQVFDEVDHVAHKSSVHITNHILATLCEFTATLPGLRRAIEAHKRSVQNYESCQENLEALENDAILANDGKRVKTARGRFRSATEELATEEEKLYRSFTEVEENRVKVRRTRQCSDDNTWTLVQVQRLVCSFAETCSSVFIYARGGVWLENCVAYLHPVMFSLVFFRCCGRQLPSVSFKLPFCSFLANYPKYLHPSDNVVSVSC